jgi:arsenate reductase-like glutaredoxin family protein
MVFLYGIPNCDTMRKDRKWLDETTAIRIMLGTPSIIRRPLLDTGDTRHVGFSRDSYREIVG